MTTLATLPTGSIGPAHPHAAAAPFEALLSASGPAFMGVFAPGDGFPDPSTLRDHIARAETFLDGCAAHLAALREAAEPMPVAEIGSELRIFVTAWPNTSGADLRGYGPQLTEDVIERRPCRYAIRSALRHLRQTSRFLPSIAEVLAALGGAEARIRNTAWHVERLPAELDRARAALAAARMREQAAVVASAAPALAGAPAPAHPRQEGAAP